MLYALKLCQQNHSCTYYLLESFRHVDQASYQTQAFFPTRRPSSNLRRPRLYMSQPAALQWNISIFTRVNGPLSRELQRWARHGFHQEFVDPAMVRYERVMIRAATEPSQLITRNEKQENHTSTKISSYMSYPTFIYQRTHPISSTMGAKKLDLLTNSQMRN